MKTEKEAILKKAGSRAEKIYVCPQNIGIVANGERRFKLMCIGEEILLRPPAERIDVEQVSSCLTPEEDMELFVAHLEYAIKNSPGKGYVFINLKPSTLHAYHREIAHEVKKSGRKIVIEIKEESMEKQEMKELSRLKEAYNLILSLDDFGTASSNFDRIKFLKPEFIKIEIPLFKTAHELVHLVALLRHHSPQSTLIAEKVETEKDMHKSILAQIDLWQGFYERLLISQR